MNLITTFLRPRHSSSCCNARVYAQLRRLRVVNPEEHRHTTATHHVSLFFSACLSMRSLFFRFSSSSCLRLLFRPFTNTRVSAPLLSLLYTLFLFLPSLPACVGLFSCFSTFCFHSTSLFSLPPAPPTFERSLNPYLSSTISSLCHSPLYLPSLFFLSSFQPLSFLCVISWFPLLCLFPECVPALDQKQLIPSFVSLSLPSVTYALCSLLLWRVCFSLLLPIFLCQFSFVPFCLLFSPLFQHLSLFSVPLLPSENQFFDSWNTHSLL